MTDTSAFRSALAMGLAILTGLAMAACEGTTENDPVETRSQSLQATSANSQPIDNQLIVQTQPGADSGDVGRSVASAHGGEVLHTYEHALDGFSIRVPDQAADTVRRALENNPNVTTVETDRTASAIAQTLPTGVDRIEADKNATADIDGTDERVDIDVAVIDTGIDREHNDLNIAGGINFSTGGETEWDDGHGHGTHVAGSVGALDNDRDVVGVAPGASLWAVRVLADDGSGTWSDILNGIDWVTKNASTIEVANMSLGGTGQLSSARTAIQNSVDAGVVYTVAAGNSSADVYGSDGTLGSDDDFIPAAYPEVAAISALDDRDGTPDSDEFASFSNYAGSVISSNPVSSPGAAIDLMLPGVYILSTQMGGGTTRLSGTSMASPHAAGLAALHLAEKGTRDLDGDGTVDASDVYQLRQTLIDRGVDQDSSDGLATLNDPDSNWERIGWAASSDSADSAPTVSWLQPGDDTTVSGSTEVQIDASDSEDDTGMLQVDWRIDGGSWRSTSYDSSNAVYSASWDTTQLEDGIHTLEGRAVDSAGNVTRTASVDMTVDNTQEGGSTTDTYVWAIDFSQRNRGKGGAKRDLRTYVTTHLDSDGDGTAESSDSALKEAEVEFVLTHDTDGDGTFECGGDDTCQRYTGSTNGKGEMKFTVKDVATGRYQAEVTALTSPTGTWDPALDVDNPDMFRVE